MKINSKCLKGLTHEQKMKFSILCVKTTCSDVDWNNWADAWLNGERGALKCLNMLRHIVDKQCDPAWNFEAYTITVHASDYARKVDGLSLYYSQGSSGMTPREFYACMETIAQSAIVDIIHDMQYLKANIDWVSILNDTTKQTKQVNTLKKDIGNDND